MKRGVWSHVATFLARGAVRLDDYDVALDVAARAWNDALKPRPFVCRRLGAWYVLDADHAKAARGNPAWPGKVLT